MAIIRSMKTGFPLHPRGNLLMHTGRSVGGHPSLGSWINYGLGSENRNLPGYVLLHGGTIPPGGLESYSNGYLPATHQAMPIRAEGAPIDNIVPADKNARVQRAKLDALLQQDRHYLETLGGQDAVESAIHNYELALPHAVAGAGCSQSRQGKQSDQAPLRARDEGQEQTSLQPAVLARAAFGGGRRAVRRGHLPGSIRRKQRHLGPAHRAEKGP